jgi:hypothetical protein
MTRQDLAWAGLFGAGSMLGALPLLNQNDLFWHLALGRAVLGEGTRVVAEPWSLLGSDTPRAVPEWLWDVLLYWLHDNFGMAAIHGLVLVLAVLFGLSVAFLMRTRAEQLGVPVVLLAPVSALAVAVANARLNERPETAAIVLTPLALALADRLVRSQAADIWRSGAALLAVELLWAQLHGTFALVPIMVGIACVDRLLARDTDFVRRAWPALLALGLGCLGSAHGFDLRAYLASHMQGDAVRHIIDMGAPAWATVNPRERPYFGFFFALLVACVALLSAARRVRASNVLYALLGLVLFATAIRSVGLAALLLLPLAMDASARALSGWDTRKHKLAATFLAVSICATDVQLNDGSGELAASRIGFDYDRVPLAAGRFLRASSVPQRVLATFAAAAPLAYFAHGQARVLMDSRTPLHFDDTDYAILRDAGASTNALERVARMFDIEVLVARNNLRDCNTMASVPNFAPVLIEWGHTTFMRRDKLSGRARAIETIYPCVNGARVREARCSESDRRAFERDLLQLGWSGPAFTGVLRAERSLLCGVRKQDLPLLPKWLQAGRPLAELRPEQRVLLGSAFSAVGAQRQAIDSLLPLAEEGNLAAALALGTAVEQTGLSVSRPQLESLARVFDGALPAPLRLALARACMRDRDLSGAYFHGMRAWLALPQDGAKVLRWVRDRHHDAAVRALVARALATPPRIAPPTP